MERKTAVGNRFFETRTEKIGEAQNKIRQFVRNCLDVPEIATVLVAVNVAADVSSAKEVLFEVDRCKAIAVTPWGKFVPALNALIAEAKKAEMTHILFVSTEVCLTSEIVTALHSHMNENTLVVGARLDGHNFQPGACECECDGVKTPWNACSLWNLTKLCRLGVPMTGDALFDQSGKSAGVEEVATIALYQHCFTDCDAKLVEIPGVKWKTEELEGERLEKHLKKMASKAERPATQLQFADLPIGKVTHV